MMFYAIFIALAFIGISFYLGCRFTRVKITREFSKKIETMFEEQHTLTVENADLKQQLADLKYQYNDVKKTLNYTESKLRKESN